MTPGKAGILCAVSRSVGAAAVRWIVGETEGFNKEAMMIYRLRFQDQFLFRSLKTQIQFQVVLWTTSSLVDFLSSFNFVPSLIVQVKTPKNKARNSNATKRASFYEHKNQMSNDGNHKIEIVVVNFQSNFVSIKTQRPKGVEQGRPTGRVDF